MNKDRPALLLVDDDPLIAESLSLVLADDFTVHVTEARKQTRALMQGLSEVPSLALVDLGLPPLPHSPDEGFALIRELIIFNPDIKILILSGQSDKANIQHALTLGAVDFIPKPCDMPLLKSRLEHQIMMLGIEREQDKGEPGKDGLLGQSPALATLRALIGQFADTPFPVLIEGESGSGKELVARYLHDNSARENAPFLTMNCAAFSADLLEAQLFGHSKGAFTGATTDKVGFFEDAGGGSLFMDEIGEMPPALQAKLLRVLEHGEFPRLGETRARVSNARIIAATNRDLRAEVRTGRFRQDLFHRLSVLAIQVPPLRERAGDCLLLLEHFRQLYALNKDSFALDKEAEAALLNYSFPGNVRELRNIAIRLSAKYPGGTVQVEQLRKELETAFVAAPAATHSGAGKSATSRPPCA